MVGIRRPRVMVMTTSHFIYLFYISMGLFVFANILHVYGLISLLTFEKTVIVIYKNNFLSLTVNDFIFISFKKKIAGLMDRL